MNSRPWCILVRNQNKTEVIGPFETPQSAARYAADVLGKPLGQTAVILPMTPPEEPQNVGAEQPG